MKSQFVILFIFTLFTSCVSSLDDPAPVGIIDGNLLRNTNGWIVESSVKEDGKTIEDLFSQYETCKADNAYKFASNGEYEIDEGDTKCEEKDSQIKESGKWRLNGDVLTLSPAGTVPYQFTIDSLTTDKLVFIYLEIGKDGVVKSTLTISFKPVGEA